MNKNFYILIGIPGSGKSTYAKTLTNEDMLCEADRYPNLYTEGRLNFDLLETAHVYCRMCVIQRMTKGEENIVQSNTNLELGENGILPYIKMAIKYGYNVHIILPSYGLLYFDNDLSENDQIKLLKKIRGATSDHIIPEKSMNNMIQKFKKNRPIYETLSKIQDPKKILDYITN
jgi:predicted kinase